MAINYQLTWDPAIPDPPASLNVMLVGDSLKELLAINSPQLQTWGNGLSPTQLLFIGPVTNGGFSHNGRSGWSMGNHYNPSAVASGFSTADQLPALLTTGGYAPDIVVIGLGTNDGLDNLAYIDSYKTQQRALAEAVWTARPNAVVVLASMMPNGAAGFEDKRDDFAAALSDLVDVLVGEGRKCMFFDLYTPLAPFSSTNMPDNTHPTDAYYDSTIEPLYRPMLLDAITLWAA